MKKGIKYGSAVAVYGVGLYLLCLYLVAPHVFWHDTSRLLQGIARKFGQAGLAAEKAYGDAIERIKL